MLIITANNRFHGEGRTGFPEKTNARTSPAVVVLTKLAFLTLYAARCIPICIIIVRGLKRSAENPSRFFPLFFLSFFFHPPLPPLINLIRLNGHLSFPGVTGRGRAG